MTLIDVTLPMTLLTHSEMDLVECMTNCVSVSLSLSLNQCCRSSAPGKHILNFSTHSHTFNMKLQCRGSEKKPKKKPPVFWDYCRGRHHCICFWAFSIPLVCKNPHTHQDSTAVLPADMALNAEWNHIGPLCHNPTLSHDTEGEGGGGFKPLPHMCT